MLMWIKWFSMNTFTFIAAVIITAVSFWIGSLLYSSTYNENSLIFAFIAIVIVIFWYTFLRPFFPRYKESWKPTEFKDDDGIQYNSEFNSKDVNHFVYTLKTELNTQNIKEWAPHKSFAITGEWGSGKSTFWAQVEKALHQDDECKNNLHIIRMSPWKFHVDEKESLLVELFLDVIFSDLKSNFGGVNLYWSTLAYASHFIPDSHPWLKPIIQMIIPETEKKLEEALESVQRRILIVIDDVDRLEEHEVKQMLRLVRSTLQLNNISTIMLMDKARVIEKLQATTPADTFMQKIVSHEYPVPSIAFETRKKFIFDHIIHKNHKNTEIDAYIRSETKDIKKLFREPFIPQLINNMRQAKRLVNAFNMHINWIHTVEGSKNDYNNTAMGKINLSDWLCLQLIEMHRAESYYALKSEFKNSNGSLQTSHNAYSQGIRNNDASISTYTSVDMAVKYLCGQKSINRFGNIAYRHNYYAHTVERGVNLQKLADKLEGTRKEDIVIILKEYIIDFTQEREEAQEFAEQCEAILDDESPIGGHDTHQLLFNALFKALSEDAIPVQHRYIAIQVLKDCKNEMPSSNIGPIYGAEFTFKQLSYIAAIEDHHLQKYELEVNLCIDKIDSINSVDRIEGFTPWNQYLEYDSRLHVLTRISNDSTRYKLLNVLLDLALMRSDAIHFFIRDNNNNLPLIDLIIRAKDIKYALKFIKEVNNSKNTWISSLNTKNKQIFEQEYSKFIEQVNARFERTYGVTAEVIDETMTEKSLYNNNDGYKGLILSYQKASDRHQKNHLITHIKNQQLIKTAEMINTSEKAKTSGDTKNQLLEELK